MSDEILGAPAPSDILPVTIEDEMRRSYLDYAMSVIVSRALPDVRDGLKPVHRRILYAMKDGGYDYNRPLRKSSRIVGDVMGKFHPHGDSAIYDAMVRMAQDFSMRLQLVEGQGNFGSMDGDPPAAMRYTEARMARSGHEMLSDIDKDTVDFQNNYDDTVQEPTVLPSKFPNLLVNGAGGIAVGMATNIPPHNLGEVLDACIAYIGDRAIEIDELMQHIPGPDFPTGGIVFGKSGIRQAYHTGRGSIVIRGRAEVEETARDRQIIVISEIPYQVNKSRMVEQIADAVRDKRIEGISDLRDESDRHGVRVVVEVKKGHMGEVVLNQLYRFSSLQTSFGMNMLALNRGKPEVMNLKDMIGAFVDFREEVITRRTRYELAKARDRAHVLAGLLVAITNLDPVIAMIRSAPDPQTARQRLMDENWPAADVEDFIALIDDPGHRVVDGHYKLSEVQARAILDLRLHRLTGLEREKLVEETREIAAQIAEFLEILQSREKLIEVMRGEFEEMRQLFGDPRRTTLEDVEFEQDIEALIQREDMVITLSLSGYVKRVPVSTYRAQRRGGKGRSGMSTRDEDVVSSVHVVNTHTPVLFFSSAGMAYKLKVYRLPLGSPQSRGKALVNLLPLADGETITTIMPMPEDEESWNDLHVMFATASGGVRRNSLSDFVSVRANGKIAMKLDDGDRLVSVASCREDQDVLLVAKSGKCIRFPVVDVRVFSSRNSTGVRGIRLLNGDRVMGMSIIDHTEIDIEARDEYIRYANAKRRMENGENGENGESTTELPVLERLSEEDVAKLEAAEQFILTVTENGFGKRSSAYEYRITNRGGQGIWNIDPSDRNGDIVASFTVENDHQLVMVTDAGTLIRIPVHGIRIAGRKTQGVRLLNTAEDETVVSVTGLQDSMAEEEDGAEVQAEAPGEADAVNDGDAGGEPPAPDGDGGNG
ncbi:MAG: DNA gyrase subunit A [Rhodospirillales bacterium]